MIEESSSSSSRSVPGLDGWVSGADGRTDRQERSNLFFFPIDEEGRRREESDSKSKYPFPERGQGGRSKERLTWVLIRYVRTSA